MVVTAAGTILLAAPDAPLSSTFTNWIDDPAIAYHSSASTDPVGILNRNLQAGTIHLAADGPSGYLRSLLDALQVPVESQVVVFAPDSVQRARIGMGNPRSLFFNDSVAVGWVRGGFIELAAQDPRQGVVFYTLEQSLLGQPQVRRRDECLTCHYSYSTAGVPGMLVRSFEQFAVDHTIPIEKRWGGWYVTGSSGSLPHLGNTDLARVSASHVSNATLNWPSFDGKFDTTGYLSTHSDIVALIVFEHQMHMMNLLTRIGWEARVAESRERRRSAPGFEKPAADEAPVAMADAAREVADYMLFMNEAPLADTIRGSSGFAARFEQQGPFDSKGRSLRQLDLHQRLMRYRCSYMVYSPLFDALPGAAREAIYQRLWQVLSGGVRAKEYQYLSLQARREIVEILQATKRDLPPYFRRPTL